MDSAIVGAISALLTAAMAGVLKMWSDRTGAKSGERKDFLTHLLSRIEGLEVKSEECEKKHLECRQELADAKAELNGRLDRHRTRIATLENNGDPSVGAD